jgi:hypothetical protein
MTKGEYKVGISFNPSANDTVTHIKEAAAALIDLIETIPLPAWFADSDDIIALHRLEVHRLKNLAQTTVEESAMWAVKAATKGSPQ